MRQALLISIWPLSAILLLTSSPLKLFQVGWGQTHIFRFFQIYLIGFKLRLWLGHSRTFTELSISHSCWVFRSIVLFEGKPSARLSFFYTLTSLSVPATEKQPHSMRLLPEHFTFGMVLCRWWAELVPFKHDAWNWGSSRPDNIISHSLRVL